MISDAQQEQASLYALDALSGSELTEFERELARNAELQKLVCELRDTAAALALVVPQLDEPSSALKQRVMQAIAGEATAEPQNVIRPAASTFGGWLPWAIAASLAIFCGLLAVDRVKLQQRLAEESNARVTARPVLVALAPAEGGPAKAEAIVAWDGSRQIGTIKINNLPAAGPGKDYQLWAVDAAHKDPISAGVIRVQQDGSAQIEFKPTDTAQDVRAFAISLETEGGVPKKEGPILLIGSA